MAEIKPKSLGPIGDRWYRFLKKKEGDDSRRGGMALFDSIPRQHCQNKLICYRLVNGYRQYGIFRTPIDFYKFYSKVATPKEFHEVTLGEIPQKPRFDIDLTMENCPVDVDIYAFGNDLRGRLIRASLAVIESYGLTTSLVDDVSVYTSHSTGLDEGDYCSGSKYSCHIVFHSFYHGNNEEARHFFDLVIAEIEKTYPEIRVIVSEGILDRAIYTSLCSLRVLGSSKDGKRTKQYVRKILMDDEEVEFNVPENRIQELVNLKLFRRSLLTDVAESTYIPVIVPLNESNFSSFDLPEEKIKPVMGILETHLEQASDQPDCPFEIEKIEGSLISLKRKRPSYCLMCERVHSQIGQFLRISQTGAIYLYCYRAVQQIEDKSRHGYYIGHVHLDPVEVQTSSVKKSSSDEDEAEDIPHPQLVEPSPREDFSHLIIPGSVGPSLDEFDELRKLVKERNQSKAQNQDSRARRKVHALKVEPKNGKSALELTREREREKLGLARNDMHASNSEIAQSRTKPDSGINLPKSRTAGKIQQRRLYQNLATYAKRTVPSNSEAPREAWQPAHLRRSKEPKKKSPSSNTIPNL